jgi:cytochrome c
VNERETFMKHLCRSALMVTYCVFAWTAWDAPAQQVDARAAQALAKKSGCLRCHAVAATRDGPSFRDTAAKFKGKADAEMLLFTHLTTNPTIKVNGGEEKHENLKTNNEADILNVVRWILTR